VEIEKERQAHEMSPMELSRFLTLLEHTLEHTKEHAEKLKDLATKAKELEKTEVHDDIMKAASEMNRATEILGNALERLKTS
jgi:hypothetical protein